MSGSGPSIPGRIHTEYNGVLVIMSCRLKAAALGLSLFAVLPGASAAVNPGWYLGLEGGGNIARDQRFRLYGADNGLFPVADGTRLSTVSFDPGYVAGVVAGYAFDFGLRSELELAHRDNDFDGIVLANGRPSTRVGGREFADIAFGNLWFDLFPAARLHPYLGGGAGVARIAVRDPAVDNSGLFLSGAGLRSDFDAVFAWQAGGGLRFDLGRSWTASLDYRYLRANRGRFDLLANNPDTTVGARYSAHSALASIHYHFGAPAPAPVPVEAPVEPVRVVPLVETPAEEAVVEPAPPEPGCEPPYDDNAAEFGGCKPGDVVVLRGVNFAFDKAALTLSAKALLDGVAHALKRHDDIRLTVQGHTDSRGADAYNLRLSEARAQAVRDYLIAAGIDAGRMTAAGFGETQPVADNASEDGRELNRRVELKIVERAAAP